MSEVHSRQTKTPPDLKWLLNERAALFGAREVSAAHMALLLTKLGKAEERFERLNASVEAAKQQMSTVDSRLAALDRTLGLMYSEVSPAALGMVNAWQGKYGKRGGLRDFLVRTLQKSYPNPVSMTLLTDSVAVEFGIPLSTRAQRMRQQLSIRGQLRHLKEQGKVKSLRSSNDGFPGMWLWVADQLPSLSELAQRSAALRTTDT